MVKSIKTASVNWSLSKDENTTLVNITRAAVVEKLEQKPDWKGIKYWDH